MKIYYEDNHVIVVEKPANIPTQADSSNDEDMLTLIKSYLKETYQKPGNVYLGLVHRLDRPVSGIMVFAKTSKAASRLSDQVRRRTFDKRYLAIVEGVLEPGILRDYMIKDKKTNTSRVTDKNYPESKYAELEIIDTCYQPTSDLSQIKISLLTGRSHQIRVQCASRKHPLWGDARYNKHAQPGQQIALHAYQISFDHPTTKERMTFESHAPQRKPFNLF